MSIKKIAQVFIVLTILGTVLLHASSLLVSAQSGTNLRIMPATQSVTAGQTATVTVEIQNVQNLGGFQFTVNFNPQVVQVATNCVTTNANFLAVNNRSAVELTPTIDNTTGTVSIGAFSFNGWGNGATGAGTLVTIVFNTVGTGTTNLQLSEIILVAADLNSTQIPTTQTDATIPAPQVSASPSPSATAGVSPTPTSDILVQVRFQGISQDIGSQLISFRAVRSTGGETIGPQDYVFVPNSNGIYEYTFPAGTFAGGTYNLFFKGPVHLTRKFSDINIDGNTQLLNLTAITLLAGDAVTNDIVDLDDYNRVYSDFGPRYPGSSTGDFNFDDDVDIYDYSYLVTNFDRVGDTLSN